MEHHEVIIVAEDSPPNRKILGHLLAKMYFHVEACSDGAQAWALMQKLKGQVKIAGVITDIMMPNMGGIELLKNIRSTPEFAQIPVVLVTALSDKEHIVEAKNHHVNGYILKPITYEKIHAKLKDLFPNHNFPLKTG